ncbi:MAG: YbdD/YjiX family protein [Gemmatimonadetes bacterium]|nr:YbdD/YjiX family protein [Gemmatimonadota bacterium]
MTPARATTHAPLSAGIARALAALRRIIGVPDYDRYVQHMHAHHPGCAVLPRDEFMRERMADRYGRPGNRCC